MFVRRDLTDFVPTPEGNIMIGQISARAARFSFERVTKALSAMKKR